MDASLGLFYQDFTPAIVHFKENYFGDFDAEGIPMQLFGSESRYNQIYIIQYGLILHDRILRKEAEETEYDTLKKCVDWLEKQLEPFGADSLIIRNQFDYPRFGLKSGWVSAMYQGQLISLFLRYGQLAGEDDKYIKLCDQIANYFRYSYEDGGVARHDRHGNFWLEEYPSPDGSFVLNGFIYAYFGILDLYRVYHQQHENLDNLIKLCQKTLLNSLSLYDSGYWSIYDQEHAELASIYYHKNIHIPLMEILFEQTQEPIFKKYLKRWKRQLNVSNIVWVKIMYRVRPRWRRLFK